MVFTIESLLHFFPFLFLFFSCLFVSSKSATLFFFLEKMEDVKREFDNMALKPVENVCELIRLSYGPPMSEIMKTEYKKNPENKNFYSLNGLVLPDIFLCNHFKKDFENKIKKLCDMLQGKPLTDCMNYYIFGTIASANYEHKRGIVISVNVFDEAVFLKLNPTFHKIYSEMKSDIHKNIMQFQIVFTLSKFFKKDGKYLDTYLKEGEYVIDENDKDEFGMHSDVLFDISEINLIKCYGWWKQ